MLVSVGLAGLDVSHTYLAEISLKLILNHYKLDYVGYNTFVIE